jgi:uncharacterized membrane protein YbhN (UPF0104 family)
MHPGRAFGFVAFTMVIWLLDGFGTTIMARALNLSLTLPQALLLLVALGLSSAVPSTPGYIGVYQFVAVTVLPVFGFTNSQAIAYILASQAFTFAIVSVLGMVGMWRLGAGKDIIRHGLQGSMK